MLTSAWLAGKPGIQKHVGTVGDGRRDSLDRYGELCLGTARLVERGVPSTKSPRAGPVKWLAREVN